MNKVVCHDKNSPSIRHLCYSDTALKNLIRIIGDISYSISDDYFTFFVNTIISQMLSAKVANVLFSRLHFLFNGDISPERFNIVTISDLRNLGLSTAKAEYIINLAKHFQSNPDFFNNLNHKSDKEIIDKLTRLRGIGIWSAKMFLMFMLDRPDVLPYEDGAFQQSFKWLYPGLDNSKETIVNHCKEWSPYSSVASRYLYKALDMGFTKHPLSLLI